MIDEYLEIPGRNAFATKIKKKKWEIILHREEIRHIEALLILYIVVLFEWNTNIFKNKGKKSEIQILKWPWMQWLF